MASRALLVRRRRLGCRDPVVVRIGRGLASGLAGPSSCCGPPGASFAAGLGRNFPGLMVS
jgi:hypothetical protein